MQPKVSITIATYNRARYVVEALESALAQTYPNIELIVVNDGSTDNTGRALKPYLGQIRYIPQENRGWAEAKNRGLAASTGELLCILDDDDRLHPTKVARQVELFQKVPELGICATAVNIVDEDGQYIEHFDPPKIRRQTQVLEMLRTALVNQSSSMMRRECYETLGGLKQMHSDDYEFWLRASVSYRIGIIRERLTDYRRHSRQLTRMYGTEIDKTTRIVIRDFIAQTPMPKLIPGLKCETAGHGIIGMILCERDWLTLAAAHLETLLPEPVGHFAFGILNVHARNFARAKHCFERARCPHFHADAALALVDRAQDILRRPHLDNYHPDVLALRKDMNVLRTTALRYLFGRAIGKAA